MSERAAVSEEMNGRARKLLADLFGLSVENLDAHFGKKDVAEDVATIADALNSNRRATLKEAREALKLRDSRALFECWLRGEIEKP